MISFLIIFYFCNFILFLILFILLCLLLFYFYWFYSYFIYFISFYFILYHFWESVFALCHALSRTSHASSRIVTIHMGGRGGKDWLMLTNISNISGIFVRFPYKAGDHLTVLSHRQEIIPRDCPICYRWCMTMSMMSMTEHDTKRKPHPQKWYK